MAVLALISLLAPIHREELAECLGLDLHRGFNFMTLSTTLCCGLAITALSLTTLALAIFALIALALAIFALTILVLTALPLTVLVCVGSDITLLLLDDTLGCAEGHEHVNGRGTGLL